MTFFDYIKSLQSKPLAERKKIATTFSVIGTSIITLLWLSTFLVPHSREEVVAEGVDVDLTPLTNIKAAGADIFQSLGSLKEIFSRKQVPASTSTETVLGTSSNFDTH